MQQLATLYPLMELRLSMIMRRLRAKCDGLLLITYHRHFFVPPAKTEMMDIKASRKDQRVGLFAVIIHGDILINPERFFIYNRTKGGIQPYPLPFFILQHPPVLHFPHTKCS
ncbi:hypothetical protein CDAR_168601 [Caerostris darwini]|uniref:Uncharacterized protein n=1 Tax=Caerostris darwini TaxID=1538125 RepID=A0AAV4T6A3_9ARAC|nr:hypothetical protein CDAR_168601 [Caerostris darwini]